MLLTTNSLDTIRIKKELGVINISIAGMIDYQNSVEDVIKDGLERLKGKAINLGADAVSGIKIEILGSVQMQKHCQIIIYGTAHNLRDIDE